MSTLSGMECHRFSDAKRRRLLPRHILADRHSSRPTTTNLPARQPCSPAFSCCTLPPRLILTGQMKRTLAVLHGTPRDPRINYGLLYPSSMQSEANMTCRASSGSNVPPVGATLKVGSGFSGECVRAGRILRCDDTEEDARVDRESCRALVILT